MRAENQEKFICGDCFKTGKYKTESLRDSEKELKKGKCYVCGKEELMTFRIVDDNVNLDFLNEYGKVNIDSFANWLINKNNLRTLYTKNGEIIYRQDGFIWREDGREFIEKETEKELKSFSKKNLVNEIVSKIKRLTSCSKENFFNEPEHIIIVKNGALNLKTKELLNEVDSIREYFFKTHFNLTYHPTADCPKIKKFLEENIYPQDIPVIQEWFGFCLYKKYFIKKALILFGDTDTGKTVLLSLLEAFLGKHNIIGLSLQKISSGDKFALYFLKDKYANIYDDLSSRDLNDGGAFKLATGGGSINAEEKFGEALTFLNHAKEVFACNKIPPLKDVDDDAYYSRWMPLAFDNQIPVKEQDKFLIAKLTTEEELSGLLNFALEGLERLLKNGSFSFDKSSAEIKVIMMRNGNPLVAFANDCLKEEIGAKITKEQMYQVYLLYTKDKKLTPLSKTQLGRNLQRYASYLKAKHNILNYWENVSIVSWNTNNKEILDSLDTLKKTTININSNQNIFNITQKEASKESNSGGSEK